MLGALPVDTSEWRPVRLWLASVRQDAQFGSSNSRLANRRGQTP